MGYYMCKDGQCAYSSEMCVTPKPSSQRESQHWQTGGKYYAELYSRTCKNIITSCINFCLKSGNTTRSNCKYTVPRCRTDRFKNSYTIWTLPLAVDLITTLFYSIIFYFLLVINTQPNYNFFTCVHAIQCPTFNILSHLFICN